MKNLLCEVKFLRNESKSMKRKDISVPTKGPESNTIMSHKGDTSTDDPIPVEPLIVLDGGCMEKQLKYSRTMGVILMLFQRNF